MGLDGVGVQAINGFTEFKTSTVEELPDAGRWLTRSTSSASLATGLIDAGNAFSKPHPRPRDRFAGTPYTERRTLHSGDVVLSDRQRERSLC